MGRDLITILKRFIGHFQHKPLLRIRAIGFIGSHREERSIKMHGILAKEIATLDVYLDCDLAMLKRSPGDSTYRSHPRRIGMVIAFGVEALWWYLSMCRAAFSEHLPELLARVRVAWKAHGHANDGNWLRSSISISSRVRHDDAQADHSNRGRCDQSRLSAVVSQLALF